MKLSPINRVILTPEMKHFLDEVLNEKHGMNKNYLYLCVLKSGDYKPGHSEDTWPLGSNDDDDDVLCG